MGVSLGGSVRAPGEVLHICLDARGGLEFGVNRLTWPPGEIESLKAKLNLSKLCCYLSELEGDVFLAGVVNQHGLSK